MKSAASISALALLAGLLSLKVADASPAAAAGAGANAPKSRATIRINDEVLPNLNGLWARTKGESFFIDPSAHSALELNPPYKPALLKSYNEYRDKVAKTGIITRDPTAKCLPPGVPRMMSAVYPLEILMTPGQVTVTEEWGPETRRIYTDGRKHPADPDITYTGNSIGHWTPDGTLVIDTIAIEPETLLDQSGLTHSDQMHVVERIRLLNPDLLQNQMTIYDPVSFTHPWTITRLLKRTKHGETVMEYVCEQNSRNPIGTGGQENVILQGAPGQDLNAIVTPPEAPAHTAASAPGTGK